MINVHPAIRAHNESTCRRTKVMKGSCAVFLLTFNPLDRKRVTHKMNTGDSWTIRARESHDGFETPKT